MTRMPAQNLTQRATASPRLRELGLYLSSALLAVLVTIYALRLWRMNIRIPLEYSGDSILISSHFKTIIETGWYFYQPLLGAPKGQEYFDWKIADNLNMVFGWIMRWFTADFAVVHNLYFLIGFPLAALTSTYFFRVVGISRLIALPLSVLVAITPYHFIRGEHHQWLSSYYPIPLALAIVYLVLRGRPIWSMKVDTTRETVFRIPPAVMTAVSLLLISTVNSYYAIITAILLAFAGIVGLVRTRRFKQFFAAAVAGVSIAIVLALSLIPWLAYGAAHGPNPEAISRLPLEAEIYSLKLTQLLLPMPGHRIPALSNFRALYDAIYPYPAESPVLGFIGAIGFVCLLLSVVYFVTAPFRRTGNRFTETSTKIGTLTALALLCFTFGTLGGLGTVVSFFTSDLRGWNRIAIFIVILSVAGFGVLVDLAVRRAHGRIGSARRFTRPMLAAITALVILGVGVFDQTSPAIVPAYASVKAEWKSDANFVDDIVDEVGPAGMILQLPYRGFPETGPTVGTSPDTDQLKLYLHSHTLQWSGGGIKGRPATDWVAGLQTQAPSDILDIAAAAGFDGVTLDQTALDDKGLANLAAFTTQLGAPMTNSNGRYAFFTLDSVKANLSKRWTTAQIARVGELADSPVDVSFLPNPGTSSVPDLLGAYSPRFTLENDRDTSISTQLTFYLGDTSGDHDIRLTMPDGTEQIVKAVPTSTYVDITLDVPAGQSEITFAMADGSDFDRKDWDFGPLYANNVVATDLELAGLLK